MYQPRFLLFQQLYGFEVSLPFVVTVYVQFVPLVPLPGFLKEVGFFFHGVLQISAQSRWKEMQYLSPSK